MKGKKVLITGAAGLYGRAVAEALAKDNEVWGLSRFDEAERQAQKELEAQGIKCIAWDMGAEDVPAGVPADITHVLHTAMLRETDNYDAAIDVNSFAAARLLLRFQKVESFCFVSSMGVYKRQTWEHRHKETDPLGGGLVFIPAYQVSKIAAEAVVRTMCKLYNIPVVIVRPNVVYGPHNWGGAPIMFLKKMLAGEPVEAPLEGELQSMPIHTDDVARMSPALFAAASVPATVVNLAGDEAVKDSEYLAYVSELTGAPIKFHRNATYYRDMFCSDNAKRVGIAGKCEVTWRDGVRRTIQAHFPDLIKS